MAIGTSAAQTLLNSPLQTQGLTKMKMKCVILLLILLVSSIHALASPCGTDGMTVLRADDGSGYLFYVYREGPDIYFQLPGKEISFPDGTHGPLRVFIDGIFLEVLLVKPAEFMKPEKGVSDLDILKKHKTYEFDYMQKTPTPLREFVELGPREKPATNGQPGFTFYLWAAADPKDKGTRQYFLTTVTAGEVVELTAIVSKGSEEAAMQAFEFYAGSFQHVLKKEQCPEKTPK